MFNTFKSLRPWKRVKASTWMLDAMPKPHAKLWILMPFGFNMTPPAPALPGLPFAAPSKNRECLGWFVIHPWNSFVVALICQSLGKGILFAIYWNWRSREKPQFMSCWLRLKSSLCSLRHSFNWHLTLTATSLASCSWFLKILLFSSSQICQQIILGRVDQAALIILFFGGGPGYLFNQLAKRSGMEEGKAKLELNGPSSSVQMCFVKVHSNIRWVTFSWFSLQRLHLEGPWNPRFWRLSS